MSFDNLPGAELILPGVDELYAGKNDTVGAFLIAIAATRLSNAGLIFPNDNLASDPELNLYAHLERERSDAYPYYNALLDSLNSFCNALEQSQRNSA